MLSKQNRVSIIKKYLKCINSKLDSLFKKDIINRQECQNKIYEYLDQRKNFIPNDVILVSYKVKIITLKDIKKSNTTKEGSINYENIIENKKEDLSHKFSVIYTNAEDSNLKNFDFDKIYFMYNEKIIPDESYSYLLKECIIYIYLSDKYLNLINPECVNLQIQIV